MTQAELKELFAGSIQMEEAKADIAFLLSRSDEAGSCRFGGHRWTGMSSNSLVRFAFGGEHDRMPLDRSDYGACVLTVRRLPKHRRTPKVLKALWVAKAAYLENFPEDRSSLDRRAHRLAWEAEERARWQRRGRRRRS